MKESLLKKQEKICTKRNFSFKKITSLLMVIFLIVLAGCGKSEYVSKEIRIGSLKGPTSIGLMSLMQQDLENKAKNDYTFTMEAQADTLLPLIIKGELDIALVPANVASVLYQKTKGGITVIDINTLGVLYMVSGDTSISGEGTTPDYVLQYLLTQAGILNDVTLEYKSEPTEVAAILSENPNGIGLLPQPFVTAALAQNDKLSIVLDLNEEWNKVQGDNGSSLVTGVTIVRDAFLEENEDAVVKFMEEHKKSAEYANESPKETADLMVTAGIMEKSALAEKAIPMCNITYLDGKEAKTALEGYLNVLFEADKEAVGGALPGEDFYYLADEK